jgi:hypothetical protein
MASYPFPMVPPAPGLVRRRRSLVPVVVGVVIAILVTTNVGTLLAWTSIKGHLETTRHDLLARDDTLRSVRETLDSTKQDLSDRSDSLHQALGTIKHARTCINGMASSFLRIFRSPTAASVLRSWAELRRIRPDCRAVIHGGGGGGSSLF